MLFYGTSALHEKSSFQPEISGSFILLSLIGTGRSEPCIFPCSFPQNSNRPFPAHDLRSMGREYFLQFLSCYVTTFYTPCGHHNAFLSICYVEPPRLAVALNFCAHYTTGLLRSLILTTSKPSTVSSIYTASLYRLWLVVKSQLHSYVAM